MHAKLAVSLHAKKVHRVTILAAIGVNSAIVAFFFFDMKSAKDLMDTASALVAVAEHILPAEVV